MQGLLRQTLIPSSRRTLMHPGVSIASLAGLLTIAGPLYFAVGDALGVPLDPLLELQWQWQPWVLLAGCIAITVGGLAMNANRRWDQQLAAAGLIGALAALAPQLTGSPGVALAVALGSAHLAFEAWTSDRPVALRLRSLTPTHRDLSAAGARAACVTALAGWLLVWIVDRMSSPGGLGPALLALGGAWAFVAHWLTAARAWRGPVGRFLTVCACGSLAVAAWRWENLVVAALSMAVVPAAALLVLPYSSSRPGSPFNAIGVLFERPAYLLVATFAAVCAGGTVLLALPASSSNGASVGWLDAAFTSVSAVCVTGLIVLDTPKDFSLAGQGFILLLIQIGGLGIMTYSTAILVLLGRRLGLKEESVLAATVAARDRSELKVALARLIKLTFVTEALGAAALIVLFLRHGDGPAEALWRGVFTAISAFCNAGFALQSDSLMPYQQDPWTLHVVGSLIVVGGLSPAVVFALPAVFRRQERLAQVWIVITASAFLLVVDALLIGAIEWSRTLGHLGFWDRLHNAWFQSVTLRTAGFNSIDLTAAHPAALGVMMVSMFIGGSPGGTAGGIKTTTAAVLALAVMGAISGRTETQAFGRRIPMETVLRAAAIAILGLAVLFAVVTVLLLTQAVPPMEAIFEGFSALGTVGLSTGATARLDGIGKMTIMIAMFAGRVGPVSMFAFLASRSRAHDWRHPVERIDVG